VTPAILHIGFGKTGSTSIQASFAAARDRLAAAGWHYARFTQFGRETPNHSRAFVNLYGEGLDNFAGNLHAGKTAAEQAAHFRAEMDAALAAGQPAIFSGEVISTLRRAALKRMRADFTARGYAPRVIAYIRAPAELIHSVAQQRVRNGWGEALPPQPMRAEIRDKVIRIRAIFPEAEFHPFAEAAGHPKGPAGHLADLIAPGLSDQVRPAARNPRISDNATQLIWHVNRLVPMFWQGARRHVSPLRLAGDLTPLMTLPGPGFFLRSAERAHYEAEVAAEAAWLAEHLGPAFADARPTPQDRPVEWTAEHAGHLDRLLPKIAKPLRVAAADYFRGRDDLPPALAALPRRYRLGGQWWLRYKRGGPGVAQLEYLYRKMRGQW